MARRRLSRAWGAGAGAGAGAASEGVIRRVAIRQESASTTVCNNRRYLFVKTNNFCCEPTRSFMMGGARRTN